MIRCHDRRTRVAVVAAALLTLGASSTTSQAFAKGNPNPGTVIPVNREYEELAAAWWQWAFSSQTAESPLFDLTGEFACRGDEGPGNVFFLAGVTGLTGTPSDPATVTREIVLPTGVRAFFPILNVVADPVGIDPEPTVAELYDLADQIVDTAQDLSASLDGQPIEDLFSYRAISDPFCYTLPETDNFYQFFGVDVSGEVCPAVADGYWLLLKPLKPGDHTLRFSGSFGPPFDFSLDITYEITVVPRGRYPGCP